LDLRTLAGKVFRTVTFSCNDPQNPSVVLAITGVHVPLFEITPYEIQMELASGQQQAVAQILPLVQLHAPLSRVQLDNTNMTAQISTQGPGRFALAVQAKPTLPQGREKFRAVVQSTDPNDPVCVVAGLVNNPPDLEVMPPSLQLEAKAEPQSRMLWLRQHGHAPMSLLDVVAPSETMRVTVEPDATGYNYRLEVLAWGQAGASGATNQLLLKMRDQANRDHSIPVPVVVNQTEAAHP
jgi:hypothetical protein